MRWLALDHQLASREIASDFERESNLKGIPADETEAPGSHWISRIFGSQR